MMNSTTLDPSDCEIEAFNSLPFELQTEVLRRLPLAVKLRLRLINQHWNELIRNGMELTLIWEPRWNKRFLHSSSGCKRNLPIDLDHIPSVAELRQSQLAGRIYKLQLTILYDDGSMLQTIRDLGACFNEVLLRPLTLELMAGPIVEGELNASLAQDGARLRLVRVTLAGEDDAAGQQQIAQTVTGTVNYLLDDANHLQDLHTTASFLARLQRMPLAWNNTLTTLELIIRAPAYGATCMQMVAAGMRNLQEATFEIRTDVRDERFFMHLSGLTQLRKLTIFNPGGDIQFKYALPLLASPGLLNLQTLTLERAVRLARDPTLFARMPRLESLVLELDSEEWATGASLESKCREAVNILIGNCHAGSLPSLRSLSLQPFLGRWNPDNDEDDDDVEAWLQSPTLDFELAQISTAAAKCPRLEILKLFWDSFGDLSLGVLLPSLEQCPIDYLLASPHEIKISSFKLADLLNEPQYLLDYAIGMQRTGLQRLTIRVSGSNEANRAATQRVIQNTIRLLALDMPKLIPKDIEQKSTQDEAYGWSESIVFFERDSERRHELRLSTLRRDWLED